MKILDFQKTNVFFFTISSKLKITNVLKKLLRLLRLEKIQKL